MKNFTGERREGGFRGDDRGGKPGFQKKSWESKDKQMYKATCSECGKPCEVPFRPDGSKPVYCVDCFNKKRDATDTRGARPSFNDRFAPRSDARPAFKPSGDGKQLAEISQKLDRLIAAMEKMTTPSMSAKVAPAATPKTEKVAAHKAVAKKVAKKKVVAKKKK